MSVFVSMFSMSFFKSGIVLKADEDGDGDSSSVSIGKYPHFRDIQVLL
jgi:predicted NodU family carbamoyl transferase